MIRAHQLISDILSGQFYCPAGDTKARMSFLTKHIVPAISSAQKFDFSPLAGRDMSDAIFYGQELLASGENPFPFDICYIEILLPIDDGSGSEPWAGLLWDNDLVLFMKSQSLPHWGDLMVTLTFGEKGIRVATAPHVSDERVAAIKEFVTDYFNFGACVLGSFCLMQSDFCRTDTVPAPAALNAKRAKKGRPPIFEHKVVTLSPQQSAASDAVGGTHASPRLHWRRGHIRALPGGSITRVRPCLVGDIARGFVSHDYKVRP
jgi:hypothetical protein